MTSLKRAPVTAEAAIGAGIIGASIALDLSCKGTECALWTSFPAGQGSTSYSSGICRMFYSIQDSVNFSWRLPILQTLGGSCASEGSAGLRTAPRVVDLYCIVDQLMVG